MLEASKDIFLDSDWATVAELPAWAQAYAEEWPVPTCQAAMYWNEAPAGMKKPVDIEVYVNGQAEAALAMTNGVVDYGSLEELAKEHQAIAIEFDGVVRYVEIEGKVLLDTVGNLILPECLVNPAAQAQMLIKLAS